MDSWEIHSRRTIRRRSFGKVSVIVVPLFKRLSTWMFPPWSSTTLLAKVNPNPTRSGWVEKKGSKIRSRFFLGIPPPLSEIETPMFLPSPKREIFTNLPFFPIGVRATASMLFFKIWKRALAMRSLSMKKSPSPSKAPVSRLMETPFSAASFENVWRTFSTTSWIFSFWKVGLGMRTYYSTRWIMVSSLFVSRRIWWR